MYTASRPLVDRYLSQALLISANSASIVEIGFGFGLEIRSFIAGYRLNEPTIFCRTSGFVSTVDFVAEMGLFTARYGRNGLRILCRIGGIVGFGGLMTAPPEALGSIGVRIIFSMIFVSANNLAC
jgi:hypothetical protein